MRSGYVVFLVGFMGAGKTSVGRALGRRLGWEFEDLDDRIQAREGRTIEAIFRESGEAEFRRAELAALSDLLTGSPSSSSRVIALGGGAFANQKSRALLASSGAPIVFLDASVEELWRRCAAETDSRPLRRNQEQFRQLYEVRRSAYLEASLHVDTEAKDVETVAGEVLARLGFNRQADH